MRFRQTLIIAIVSQMAVGCTLLKLQPEPETGHDIQVFWEEGQKDQDKVTHTNKRKSSSEQRKQKEVVAPIIIVADTLKEDHSALFAEIETWKGTPYGYGIHEKSKGTDCSGFTLEIYSRVYGIQLNRSSEGQVANTIEIKKEELQIGDLVFFNIRGSRISHVGLYIGNNKFVHASVKSGVIVSDLDETYYKQRYARSGRVIKPGKQ